MAFSDITTAIHSSQLAATSTVSSVTVADVDLPLANEMKVFGIILDRHLTFEKHVSRFSSCAIMQLPQPSHPPHSPSADDNLHRRFSDTVKARLYCNAVLHGIPSGNIQKLQRVQNSAARIVLQTPRRSHTKPLLRQLHWLPVQHRITYKLAVLTYRVRTTSTPAYLSRHMKLYVAACGLYTLDHNHSIVRTVRQYNICQACIPLFCSGHLELSAKNSY